MRWFKRRNGKRFKVGDFVYPKKGYDHLYEYFYDTPQMVVKITETPRLSYCDQFVYIKYVFGDNGLQGFYNTALNKIE